MAITKKASDRGSLFDSVINTRDAFKKPAEQSFPPIIDPDVKAASALTKKVQKSAAPVKTGNAYEYAGALARKSVLWEGVLPQEALPANLLEDERNRMAVEAVKAKAKRASAVYQKSELDNRAKSIVLDLPRNVRPMATCKDFPHIVNLVMGCWHDPRSFVQTLQDLLMDDRGGRQGFPFAIIVELTDLREHYFAAVRPEARKMWDRL
jgi:hypothetical protein